MSIAFYVLAIVTFVSSRNDVTPRHSCAARSYMYIFELLQLVSFERLVFDVFGQMWGTMLLNAMSTVSLLGGVLSVCAAEKLAIALVSYYRCKLIQSRQGINVLFVCLRLVCALSSLPQSKRVKICCVYRSSNLYLIY